MAPDLVTSMLPTLASAGFEARRHGTLRVAVCDTDFLMNQTEAATNPLTSLLVGFSGINQRAYSAQHVFDELYRDDGYGHPTKFHKLSEQARAAGDGVPASAFRDAFEDRFLPKLTFVNMGDLFTDHSLVERVRNTHNGRGASDVPTAQLAVLLSRLRPVTPTATTSTSTQRASRRIRSSCLRFAARSIRLRRASTSKWARSG